MTRKVANIIQWASIVIGITGMSFDKLVNVQSTVSYLLIGISFAAFAVLVFVQIFHRDANVFNGKRTVDLAWRALLTRADSSVAVFAGDVSWAESSKNPILERTQLGVVIRVLCRWPSTPILLEQVRVLFGAGVQVKYYTGDMVKLRGLVVDTKTSLDNGTALTVTKHPKQRIALIEGEAGTDSLFDYHARRYLPGRDMSYIAMLHQLFDSVWETLPPGVILDRLVLDADEVRHILSRIPHYSRLTTNSISIEMVSCASLYSCCRTVKAANVAKGSPLLEGYERFGLEFFEPCRVEGSGNRTVVLPPIVERQPDGTLVIIDGMHRIYNLTTRTDAQQVMCLVLSGAGPLPSDPIPFQDVRLSVTKKPRVDNFPNYKHEHFRDIEAVDRYLSTVADRYPYGRTQARPPYVVSHGGQ